MQQHLASDHHLGQDLLGRFTGWNRTNVFTVTQHGDTLANGKDFVQLVRNENQRVPIVDTSNPAIARWIPTADESMVVIRFANPRGIDFPYLISMIDNSFMSRANTIVIPGGKLAIAMQLILTPMILRLMERRRRAR